MTGMNPKYSYNAKLRLNEAARLISVYRVTAAALESGGASAEGPRAIENAVQAIMAQKALELGVLWHQIRFNDLIDTMKREEQADVVFSAFGPRSRNQIDASELETGLEPLRAISKKEYPPGDNLVSIFANRRNGNVRRDDFASIIDALAAVSIDCTFEDMCHLLLQVLIFSKSGGDIIVETVSSIAGQSRFKLDEAVTEARLMLLYKAMIRGGSEIVVVKDVYSALDPLLRRAGERTRQSLLELQCWNLRKLDYELFSDHMMDILSCLIGMTMNDLIKEMTVAICSGEIDDDLTASSSTKSHDSGSSLGSFDSTGSRRSF